MKQYELCQIPRELNLGSLNGKPYPLSYGSSVQLPYFGTELNTGTWIVFHKDTLLVFNFLGGRITKEELSHYFRTYWRGQNFLQSTQRDYREQSRGLGGTTFAPQKGNKPLCYMKPVTALHCRALRSNGAEFCWGSGYKTHSFLKMAAWNKYFFMTVPEGQGSRAASLSGWASGSPEVAVKLSATAELLRKNALQAHSQGFWWAQLLPGWDSALAK